MRGFTKLIKVSDFKVGDIMVLNCFKYVVDSMNSPVCNVALDSHTGKVL